MCVYMPLVEVCVYGFSGAIVSTIEPLHCHLTLEIKV